MRNGAEVEELIYRSCLLLDSKDFKGYLAICAPAYSYKITTYSPEIRKDMTWLEHDKAGMEILFNNLPRHNSDQSLLSRHATVYTIETDPASNRASVMTALQVFKTSLDGGKTELFAVGKYCDTVDLSGDRPVLQCRNVRLVTRMLGIGYHIPF